MKKVFLWGIAVFATLAFLACPPEPEKENPVPLKLTVSSFDSSAGILGATLLKDGLSMENAVAVAMANTSGVFTFNHFSPPMNIGDPFTSLGSYYIALVTSLTGSGTNYVYIGSGQIPAIYEFTSAEAAIPWRQFYAQEGEPSSTLTLTVTGIPEGTPIEAAALLTNLIAPVPVGVSMNSGGTFTFIGVTPGAYYLVLAENTDRTGTSYIYRGSGPLPLRYNFTTEPATLSWEQFMDASSLMGGG
ncbi:MAG: carboxypeptidase-like regulatory domain-containing protein [Treponema sp.]|jgi:hypothetical protein|nr:carboxypeptidase-like regulatory domain-containing protein [Treponema sp.]